MITLMTVMMISRTAYGCISQAEWYISWWGDWLWRVKLVMFPFNTCKQHRWWSQASMRWVSKQCFHRPPVAPWFSSLTSSRNLDKLEQCVKEQLEAFACLCDHYLYGHPQPTTSGHWMSFITAVSHHLSSSHPPSFILPHIPSLWPLTVHPGPLPPHPHCPSY